MKSSNFNDKVGKRILSLNDNGSFLEYSNNLLPVINYIDKTINIRNNHKKNENNNNLQTTQLRLFGGELKDWKIYVNNEANLGYKKDDYSRISDSGVTGCITFNDIILHNVILNIENTNCEDGIHFVRTKGNLINVIVKNSLSDAIDADYSDLIFEGIVIHNAGNDCLDLSRGKYIINKIESINCGDKGISAGENSKVSIDNIKVQNSLIGVASKDSSIVNIENGNFINLKVCFAAYRKKKEYGGGKINLNGKINCNKIKSFVQKYSNVSYLKKTM